MRWSIVLQVAGLVLAHLAVALFVPPFLLGVINKVKALFGGRVGPPVLQLYSDLAKLFRKDAVYSRTTTWVFLAGPVAAVALPLTAALMVPFGGARAPMAFPGDLVAFAYLFAMARFLTVLSAWARSRRRRRPSRRFRIRPRRYKPRSTRSAMASKRLSRAWNALKPNSRPSSPSSRNSVRKQRA